MTHKPKTPPTTSRKHAGPARKDTPKKSTAAPPAKSAVVKPAAAKSAAAKAAAHTKAPPPAKAVPAAAKTAAGKNAKPLERAGKPAEAKAGAATAAVKLPVSRLGIERAPLAGMTDDRQSQLKLLIARGKEQGYLTYAEVNDHLPNDIVDPESRSKTS